MRILLFSDIHGYAAALEAVLADSLRHGPYAPPSAWATWPGTARGRRAGQYRVKHDVQRVAREMQRGGMPRGRHFAERLLRARYD